MYTFYFLVVLAVTQWEENNVSFKLSAVAIFQLSHYLDVVEVQIAKQISLRSEAFFHAMSSHDALQENMKTTCAAIKRLRSVI